MSMFPRRPAVTGMKQRPVRYVTTQAATRVPAAADLPSNGHRVLHVFRAVYHLTTTPQR
jgi:hypothetical protein